MLDISNSEIESAKRVLEDHVVNPLNREGALESLLFCISSQMMTWERASKFIYALRGASKRDENEYASWDVLTDKDKVNEIAHSSGLRFAYANRFDPSIDFFKNMNGEWWKGVLEANEESREDYCAQIKHIGRKTFSFYHVCLGGTDLIALDVHILRKLATRLGVNMDEFYYKTKPPGENGHQRRRSTPPKREYLRLENTAREIFSQDERFLKQNGEVDAALVDALLWWDGANRTGHQGYLFGGETSKLPYAKLRYWELPDSPDYFPSKSS